jgi:hypothetical protein
MAGIGSLSTGGVSTSSDGQRTAVTGIACPLAVGTPSKFIDLIGINMELRATLEAAEAEGGKFSSDEVREYRRCAECRGSSIARQLERSHLDIVHVLHGSRDMDAYFSPMKESLD